MNSPNPIDRKGFTLIEMLVVIAIIAVLASLLIPAITRTLGSAKRSRAAADARDIASAVEMFFDDYGYFPVPHSDQGYPGGSGADDTNIPDYETWKEESKRIIQVLIAEPQNYNQDHQLNPQQKIYITGQGIQSDGTFLDPWGTQYFIKLDRDYDGKVEFLSQPEQYRTRVIVVSAGSSRGLTGGENNRNERDNVANVRLGR